MYITTGQFSDNIFCETRSSQLSWICPVEVINLFVFWVFFRSSNSFNITDLLKSSFPIYFRTEMIHFL